MLDQASTGRRRPCRPHPRTSPKFLNDDVHGRSCPRPIPGSGRPRRGRRGRGQTRLGRPVLWRPAFDNDLRITFEAGRPGYLDFLFDLVYPFYQFILSIRFSNLFNLILNILMIHAYNESNKMIQINESYKFTRNESSIKSSMGRERFLNELNP